MVEFVEMEKDAPKKVKAFKTTDPWRIGFCDQYDITLRVQTNKKWMHLFRCVLKNPPEA